MSEPRNQGHCGSCYAVATLNMLEARLRIKHEINEKLSLNHILKCSVYNQGCDGGYSYLVMKFANELEMIPEKCENNSDDGGEYNCNKLCNEVKDQKRIYKVKDYKYLGGSYGKCSEELLMKELMENGPIVVSFEPEYHFMLYKKGIYKSLNEKNWITKKLDKPEWEKVDHSVTLVGWGYDEVFKEKYWLLLNSWGKHWGENGYFKMVRGIDHMGIESICEVGTIYYDDI
jgi:cathepsin C